MISEIKSNNIKNYKYGYSRDSFGQYKISSVMYKTPVSLNNAMSGIISDKKLVEDISCYRFFTEKFLKQIQKDLSKNEKLKDIKVKGMIDYGQTAFVFETEEGDILKIASRDHFLGRKSKFFDIPIKQQYKTKNKSFCRYYIEEKASDQVSHREIMSFLKEIKNYGYKIVDFGYNQFGKIKNGQVVLLDPECARKNNVLGLVIQKSAKIKSYINLLLK